jgi:SpoVK/Ycf46/Vps4 family AAA+-type ATPase
MQALLQQIVFRVVSVLLCAVVAALVTRVLSEFDLEDGSVGGGHARTVEGLLTRPTRERHGWDGLGGYEPEKNLLKRNVVLPLKYPQLFFSSDTPSLRPASGVLLKGPPGTGKTCLAHACAADAGVPLITLNPAALEQKWYGESPKILAAAFALAKRRAPCIVFIDEVEALGRKRCEGDQACVYTMKCEMLRHMDALDEAVVVLACTNCPQSLDAALARRFATQIEVGPPDEDGRVSILKAILEASGETVAPSTIKRVASDTAGKTGAGLRERYREACFARLARLDEGLIQSSENSKELKRRLGKLRNSDWALLGGAAQG